MKDIDEFKNNDPNIKICIIPQSSKQAMSINANLIRNHPALNINILTGSDSGMTKKEYFEDINLTLQACIIFIFSPVM